MGLSDRQDDPDNKMDVLKATKKVTGPETCYLFTAVLLFSQDVPTKELSIFSSYPIASTPYFSFFILSRIILSHSSHLLFFGELTVSLPYSPRAFQLLV